MVEEVKEQAALNAEYKSFLPFASWQHIAPPNSEWETRHEAILKLALNDENVLSRALEVAKRAAALETGAIEGLYELDRGVTITIATQTAMWGALLEKENAKSLIESQLAAYDYVLDFATKKIPLAEAWIRELHAVVCKAQKTYRVKTDAGDEERPLPHGAYKKSANHVLLGDGSVHAYAPVEDTPAEMARLVAELNLPSFEKAHPAVQAAYCHHALTVVHPFQDGNGRVARALASVFTYRSVRIPLLILSESRDSYFDALETADVGNGEPFAKLVWDAGILALALVEQSLHSSKRPSPLQAARMARQLNFTRSGVSHEEVDRAGHRLIEEAHRCLDLILEPMKNELQCSKKLETVQPEGVVPAGYRHARTMEPRSIQCTMLLSAPAEAEVRTSFRYYVPIDAALEDKLLIVCADTQESFGATLAELRSASSLGLQLRLSMWMESQITAAIEKLQAQGEAELARRGLAAKVLDQASRDGKSH